MHELSIAQEIIDIVKSHVTDEDRVKVRRVEIKVGELQSVLVESLKFCFSGIRELDNLDNAELFVEQAPITVYCEDCGLESQLVNKHFICNKCNSIRVVMRGGNELQIVAIELED